MDNQPPHINNLTPGPIRHPNLAPQLTERIESLRKALIEVCPGSPAEWQDDFRHDLHPEHEIAWWERVVRCYTRFVSKEPLSTKQKKAAFNFILGAFSGMGMEDMPGDVDALPASRINELLVICRETS